MKIALFVVVALLSAAPSYAWPITLSAADLPIGTDFSTLFPGVTFTRITGFETGGIETAVPSIRSAPVTALAYPNYTHPAFGEYWALSIGYNRIDEDYSVLEMVFDTPTNYLALDWTSYIDPGGILVFDANGQRVSGLYTSVWNENNPGVGSYSVTTDTATISRVVFGGIFQDHANLETLRYEAVQHVPEPSTLLMLSMGALAFMRRRAGR